MAWTTPRTWIAGEVVTAALLNAQVRDNLTYLKGDAAWIPVTFQNGWVNYGPPVQTVQYRKIGDVVYLRGTAKSGTVGSGTPIFTLPVGHRPFVSMLFPVLSSQLFGRLNVFTAGTVALNIGSNVFVALDSINFSTVA